MSNDLLFNGTQDNQPAAVLAPSPVPENPLPPWKILVVDDDREVHAVTRLALRKLHFQDRAIELLNAYSAVEAATILSGDPSIAIVLLDVVMETDEAGLWLVRHIREDLGNQAIRIILRTGQPGQAPEQDMILHYDINDYKSKVELTAQKLFTSVIAALRSHLDIVMLEANRRGLQRIIETTDRLFEVRNVESFADDVLAQLASFLNAKPDGLLCAQRSGPDPDQAHYSLAATAGQHQSSRDTHYILAGSGRFALTRTKCGPIRARDLDSVMDGAVAERIMSVFRDQQSYFADDHAVLHIPIPDSVEVVAWIHTDRALDEVDRGLVQVFASKIALSFANVSLYERLRIANETLEQRVAERTRALEEANERLRQLATIDPLTGAWNRRYFLEQATIEIARSIRHKRPLSIFLLDLDHFKQINDTLGHAAGDGVLCATVNRVQDTLRITDRFARYGGEEFVALLPDTDLAGAMVIADRIRKALSSSPMLSADTSGSEPVIVTASLGVASWSEDEPSIEHTLRRADEAMYVAKQSGRNRVEMARPSKVAG